MARVYSPKTAITAEIELEAEGSISALHPPKSMAKLNSKKIFFINWVCKTNCVTQYFSV